MGEVCLWGKSECMRERESFSYEGEMIVDRI